MRWYVEIASVGKTEGSRKICLEAAHWQPALQQARKACGEDPHLGGLSVEFLDDGCRAIDAKLRKTYSVTRAPDDAPLVQMTESGAPPANGTDEPPDGPAGAGQVPSDSTDAAPSESAKTSTARESSSGRRSSRRSRKSRRGRDRAAGKQRPPDTLARTAAETPVGKRSGDGEAEPPAEVATKAAGKKTMLGTGPSAELRAAATEAAAAAAPAKGLPGEIAPFDPEVPPVDPDRARVRLVSEKLRGPIPDAPISYLERVFGLAETLPLEEIESSLRARLADARTELGDAPGRRLVRLALFDEVFGEVPRRPPLATAEWRDWHPTQVRISFFPMSVSPAEDAAAAAKLIGADAVDPDHPPVLPLAVEVPAGGGDAPVEQPPAKRAAEPQARAKREAGAKPKPKLSKRAADDDVPPPSRPVKAMPVLDVAASETDGKSAAKAPKTEQKSDGAGTPRQSRRSLGSRKAIGAKKRREERKANGAPSSRSGPHNTPGTSSSSRGADNGRKIKLGAGNGRRSRRRTPEPPPPAEPKVLSKEQRAKLHAAARERASALPPRASKPGNRVAGEDLITDLFEEVSELHYLSDVIEGAGFVLDLAMHKIPCEAGLVSLFDIDKREFVVVQQAGGPKNGLLLRLPERAETQRRAMRSSRAVVIAKTGEVPNHDPRWEQIGVTPRSLVCAPAVKSGRYLGLIELVNPQDGKAFSDSDGHALTYIGEQFAEFLVERGVIIDPEAVVAKAQGHGD